MDLPTLSDFAPLKGEHFALVAAPGQALSAELVEVQALPQPAFNGRQPFSLVFAGPPAPVLPQCTYRLAHERLPALELFLVPVGAGTHSVRYQAVFS